VTIRGENIRKSCRVLLFTQFFTFKDKFKDFRLFLPTLPSVSIHFCFIIFGVTDLLLCDTVLDFVSKYQT
jgi:hypothetical protein